MMNDKPTSTGAGNEHKTEPVQAVSPVYPSYRMNGRGPGVPGATVAPPSGAATAVESRVLADFWEAIRRLPAYVRLVAALLRDERVPTSAKASLAAGGAYAISPIDLIPGVIPVAGQLDDLYVLLTGIQLAVRRTPDDIVTPHLERVGISRNEIDGDLAAIRALVRVAAVKTYRAGRKAVANMNGRLSARIRQALKQGNDTTNE